MYAQGRTVREIALYLDSIGIKTPRGKAADHRFVDYMLNNPVYIGKLRRSKDGKRDVSKRNFDSENILIVDGIHDPIVPIELWEKVQDIIEKRKIQYPKHSRSQQPVDFMLKGLVRCSNCGSTLVASAIAKRSTNRSLQCHKYSKGVCKISHSITFPKIESAVIEILLVNVMSAPSLICDAPP